VVDGGDALPPLEQAIEVVAASTARKMAVIFFGNFGNKFSPLVEVAVPS